MSGKGGYYPIYATHGCGRGLISLSRKGLRPHALGPAKIEAAVLTRLSAHRRAAPVHDHRTAKRFYPGLRRGAPITVQRSRSC